MSGVGSCARVRPGGLDVGIPGGSHACRAIKRVRVHLHAFVCEYVVLRTFFPSCKTTHRPKHASYLLACLALKAGTLGVSTN
eukprot:7058538-Alexandrium_andersonii.AAC.1